MLYWSLMFLIIALVAALFGFGFAAGGAAEVSQVLFFVFLGLLVLSLLANLIRKVRGAGGSGRSSA